MIHTAPAKDIEYKRGAVYVATSTIPKAGVGLFAATELERGETIATYGGEMVFLDEVRNLPSPPQDEEGRYSYIIRVSEDVAVDGHPAVATKEGHLAQFCNHSETPNASLVVEVTDYSDEGEELEYTITLMTLAPVAKGEELFVNYGPDYWK